MVSDLIKARLLIVCIICAVAYAVFAALTGAGATPTTTTTTDYFALTCSQLQAQINSDLNNDWTFQTVNGPYIVIVLSNIYVAECSS